jgi:hypothetical protein
VCPTKFTMVKIMVKENFGEVLKFFPEDLNLFKIHRRFEFESDPKLCSMNSVGNLKSTQLQKLFRIFNSSLMQSLSIFGRREGICFEFQSLERIKIRLENI